MLGTEAGRLRLVITDDRMPGMSGQELVAVIGRIYPHLRGLLMSGFGGATGPATGQDGVAPALLKPFTSEGLLEAVTDLLG